MIKQNSHQHIGLVFKHNVTRINMDLTITNAVKFYISSDFQLKLFKVSVVVTLGTMKGVSLDFSGRFIHYRSFTELG